MQTYAGSQRVLAPSGAAGTARAAKPQSLVAFSGFRRAGAVDNVGASNHTLQAAVSRAISGAAQRSGVKTMRVTRMMFERFTEKAIKVVMLAQEEARRLGHNFVGTEQILLGLIGESTGAWGVPGGVAEAQCARSLEPRCRVWAPCAAAPALPSPRAAPLLLAPAGIAAKVLKGMGVTLKDARVEVEKIIGRGSGFVAVEIPFTPRAKRVLELSLEEARQLGARAPRAPRCPAGAEPPAACREAGLPCFWLGVDLAAAAWWEVCRPAGRRLTCCPALPPAGHNYIGTEHILLGLLREGEGVASRVLETLGADPAKIRTQVIRMVGESQEPVGSAVGGSGGGSNKTPTLEEYGTNLTTMAEEVSGGGGAGGGGAGSLQQRHRGLATQPQQAPELASGNPRSSLWKLHESIQAGRQAGVLTTPAPPAPPSPTASSPGQARPRGRPEEGD